MKSKSLLCKLSLLSLVFISSCKELEYRWQYREAEKLVVDSQAEGLFLKAHLKNGEVYFFPQGWQVDTLQRSLTGYAQRFDLNRRLLDASERTLFIDSVQLFESNKELDVLSGDEILLPLTIVNVGVTAYCASNPKACFGSCPTFYTPEDQGLFESRAEGFSNAIIPSLEYGDFDDLKIYNYGDSSFRLLMKNEAHETHLLRSVELAALPVKEGTQAYQSRDGRFFRCEGLALPLNSSLMADADGEEYYSQADAENLASKEEIILEFEERDWADKALVIDFRQSLMTTYFIYSALGYMGDEVTEIFSKIEKEGNLYHTLDKGLKTELGELEVYLWDEAAQDWSFQGAFYETGPIAINRQILDLADQSNEKTRIKLKMNRGLWRIDRVALCSKIEEIAPIRIKPNQVQRNGKLSHRDLKRLNGQDQLVSMPGEVFTLDFDLPEEAPAYDLFLYAKGYYLEWMRDQWLSEKNLWKLRKMFKDPSAYLKTEASAYKEYEATMEEVFWSSQIPTHNNLN